MDLRTALLLRDDEEVVVTYRHHWVRYALACLLAAAFVVGPFFAFSVAAQSSVGMLACLGALVVGAVLVWRVARLWTWNMLVVTNERVIDVDQQGLFRRVVTEVPLPRARYVSYAVDGVGGTLLGYGTVTIEGENSNVALAFNCVPRPAEAHRYITDLVAQHHGGVGAADGAAGTRVQELLAAASELEPTDARAFMLALDRAFRKSKDASADLVPKRAGTKKKRVIPRPSRTDGVDMEQFSPEE
jgi:hypothetical protein